jgi:hypothetical protein
MEPQLVRDPANVPLPNVANDKAAAFSASRVPPQQLIEAFDVVSAPIVDFGLPKFDAHWKAVVRFNCQIDVTIRMGFLGYG